MRHRWVEIVGFLVLFASAASAQRGIRGEQIAEHPKFKGSVTIVNATPTPNEWLFKLQTSDVRTPTPVVPAWIDAEGDAWFAGHIESASGIDAGWHLTYIGPGQNYETIEAWADGITAASDTPEVGVLLPGIHYLPTSGVVLSSSEYLVGCERNSVIVKPPGGTIQGISLRPYTGIANFTYDTGVINITPVVIQDTAAVSGWQDGPARISNVHFYSSAEYGFPGVTSCIYCDGSLADEHVYYEIYNSLYDGAAPFLYEGNPAGSNHVYGRIENCIINVDIEEINGTPSNDGALIYRNSMGWTHIRNSAIWYDGPSGYTIDGSVIKVEADEGVSPNCIFLLGSSVYFIGDEEEYVFVADGGQARIYLYSDDIAMTSSVAGRKQMLNGGIIEENPSPSMGNVGSIKIIDPLGGGDYETIAEWASTEVGTMDEPSVGFLVPGTHRISAGGCLIGPYESLFGLGAQHTTVEMDYAPTLYNPGILQDFTIRPTDYYSGTCLMLSKNSEPWGGTEEITLVKGVRFDCSQAPWGAGPNGLLYAIKAVGPTYDFDYELNNCSFVGECAFLWDEQAATKNGVLRSCIADRIYSGTYGTTHASVVYKSSPGSLELMDCHLANDFYWATGTPNYESCVSLLGSYETIAATAERCLLELYGSGSAQQTSSQVVALTSVAPSIVYLADCTLIGNMAIDHELWAMGGQTSITHLACAGIHDVTLEDKVFEVNRGDALFEEVTFSDQVHAQDHVYVDDDSGDSPNLYFTSGDNVTASIYKADAGWLVLDHDTGTQGVAVKDNLTVGEPTPVFIPLDGGDLVVTGQSEFQHPTYHISTVYLDDNVTHSPSLYFRTQDDLASQIYMASGDFLIVEHPTASKGLKVLDNLLVGNPTPTIVTPGGGHLVTAGSVELQGDIYATSALVTHGDPYLCTAFTHNAQGSATNWNLPARGAICNGLCSVPGGTGATKEGYFSLPYKADTEIDYVAFKYWMHAAADGDEIIHFSLCKESKSDGTITTLAFIQQTGSDGTGFKAISLDCDEVLANDHYYFIKVEMYATTAAAYVGFRGMTIHRATRVY